MAQIFDKYSPWFLSPNLMPKNPPWFFRLNLMAESLQCARNDRDKPDIPDISDKPDIIDKAVVT